MRILFLAFLVFSLPACGSPTTLADDAPMVDADPNAPDADPFAIDADPNAPDADPSAIDANPTCLNQWPIYVNNANDVIRPGGESAPNNTSSNLSTVLTPTPVSTTRLAEVITYLEDHLAFANPNIVTTRPTGSNYFMIVLTATDSPQIPNYIGYAAIFPDCGLHFGIGFAEDSTTEFPPLGRKAAQAMGFMAGLYFTTDSCMFDTTLNASAEPCVFMNGAHKDPNHNACGVGTQDEVDWLTAAVGCH